MLKKSWLILSILLSFPAASLYAVNLTPEQQQSLKGSEYNPGSLLLQRMKELQRYRIDSEAEQMKDNSVEEDNTSTEEQNKDIPEVSIQLNKLEIPDSEILTRDELDSISNKYSGKTVT